ncbi:peptidase domain-containing ABC transporter [Methylobacterium haplocladii]|uniref:Toxin transporter n=1 Tax=Methylobacterium haplocladii TaxID=1176176 RepID=A0A512IJ27_9HYPH|nr:peptidase domain-containing ABC transporter [Methylobacterium haplocladii]GEO97705.1 toxin transporter [Methylobacterium haplocladii]GJD84420.1 Toxin RTX-I translocation ATP-binding protein [Methylobacterium haplocladii]GLS57435.1 toxin transporter [Methylobacterium haplocladii]
MRILDSLTHGGLQFGFGRRLPVILQAEAAECGMACLAMVLGHHGREVDLGSMRRRHALSLKGMTLRNLIDLSGTMGLSTRALRIELKDLARLKLPCILHWGLNHFVVLAAIERKGIVIHDPARGRRRLTLEEASRDFTGVALEVTPNQGFVREKTVQGLSLGDLFRNLRGIRPAMLSILALSVGIELVNILMPIASQIVIDEVIVNADLDLLLVVAIGLALLLLIQLALGVARTWAIMLTGTKLNYQWSGSLFDHLSRLPLDYFEKRHVGDVISRFGSLGTIQKGLTTDLVQAVLDGVMSIGMLIMLFLYGGWLALVALLSTAIAASLRIAAYNAYKEGTEEAIVAEARQQTHFIETVRGMASVKLLGLRERRRGTWMNQFVTSLNARLRLQRLDLVFGRANDLLFGADRLILLVLGARAVIDQSMSLGMLVAFLTYRDQFSTRIGNLINSGFQLRMLNVQTDRLSDIVMTEPEEPADAKPVAAPAVIAGGASRGSIVANGLSLRYGADEHWVFRNLSFTVAPGTCFAIIGPSGCGKSSVMKILMGLLSASEGNVLIDGRDIKTVGAAAYRKRIAGVMQSDGLFAGSIAENIACFDERPDPAWIEECAARAAILEDIRKTPMGFETLVGDMGSTLSGGQKQRVILARALYQRPEILFLDEATSALDEPTEAAIAQALREFRMTRVIVAHRPATIAHADHVLEFERLLQGPGAEPRARTVEPVA